jgi:hypothetical protein
MELTVEACSDQLVLCFGASAGSGLWSRVGDEVFLLEGFNCSDLVEERSAFLGNCAASG